METAQIISLVAAKTGASPVKYKQHELRDFSACIGHEDVRDYLTCCLPAERYSASSVSVHNLDRIRGEVCEGAGPGGFIFPHGYVVIASSVGGNAICFHSPSGRVFWADHESFTRESISYKDRATRKWCYLPFTPENIQRAVVQLSDNIEAFLKELLSDKLEKQFDALD